MKFLIVFIAVMIALVPYAKAETRIVVEKPLCDAYTNAQSAAYKEGVDVNGNAVAPADLPSENAMALPETIEIPLTVDLAQRLDIDMKGMELKSTLGVIRVSKDGKVTFNDKDISSNTKTLCGNSATNVISTPLEMPPPPMSEAPVSEGAIMPLPATVSPSVTVTE